MSFLHDIIKIKYIEEGYLPNYPYHLISDSEMCDAFLNNSDECYFYDNYPCIDESLRSDYDSLVNNISYHIDKLKHCNESEFKLPDWVYSYMVGSVIGPNSRKIDIHDLLVPMALDNVDDEFTLHASKECLKISKVWLKKYPASKLDHRSPTMFGEGHVMKYLRLEGNYSVT